VICARCDRKNRGLSVNDKHHPAGAANSAVTIEIPVNDHRAELSAAQYDWPEETLENPDRNPLLLVAASCRGCTDTITYLLNELLLPRVELLEELAKREKERNTHAKQNEPVADCSSGLSDERNCGT
jgi:hypothetical protein